MKLKELTLVGGTVYLNIVRTDETETKTIAADKAVERYGDLEVIEHLPYNPENALKESGDDKPKKDGKPTKEGTDTVILQG